MLSQMLRSAGRSCTSPPKAKAHVSRRQSQAEETLDYEMTLTGPDQAELKILGAPPDMPAPKPWKLERAHAAQ